jgi:hypothetical protein
MKQPHDSLVNMVGETAALRAKLWQYLREQTDAGQLKAIEDGRVGGLPWHHFAVALCMTPKQGAYQKAQRRVAHSVSTAARSSGSSRCCSTGRGPSTAASPAPASS